MTNTKQHKMSLPPLDLLAKHRTQTQIYGANIMYAEQRQTVMKWSGILPIEAAAA